MAVVEVVSEVIEMVVTKTMMIFYAIIAIKLAI